MENESAISYVASQGKEPFDWWKFLNQENYTEYELIEAADLAGHWVTCACGVACVLIPRDFGGMPKDSELIWLGTRFGECVDNMRCHHIMLRKASFDCSKSNAIAILADIEKRSAEIINEIVRARGGQAL